MHKVKRSEDFDTKDPHTTASSCISCSPPHLSAGRVDMSVKRRARVPRFVSCALSLLFFQNVGRMTRAISSGPKAATPERAEEEDKINMRLI
jgi:hypothetical protein